jgi:hypothetical protein
MQPKGPEQPILEYGAEHRWNVRAIVVRSLAAVGVIVLVAIAWPIAWSRLYLYEEVGVRSELESIRGGRVLNINSYDDPPGVKVMFAEVSVDGGSTRTIRFRGPRYYLLRKGEWMMIDEIGPHSVLVYLRGEPWPQPLRAGPDGELANVLPFKLKNVRDVAAHYDEIVSFVGSEPSGTFTDSAGRVSTWRIEVRPR